MKYSEVKEKVCQVLLDCLSEASIKDLSDDANLFDLGVNSLNTVNLVLGIEEKFNFEFDRYEISYDSFRTVSDLVRVVSSKL